MMTFFTNMADSLAASRVFKSPRQTLLDSFCKVSAPIKQNGEISPMARLWTSPQGGVVELRFSYKEYNYNLGARCLLIKRMVARNPGNGDGRAALSELMERADHHRVSLGMYAEPIEGTHKAMGMGDLREWLERNGFEEYEVPGKLFLRDPAPRNG